MIAYIPSRRRKLWLLKGYWRRLWIHGMNTMNVLIRRERILMTGDSLKIGSDPELLLWKTVDGSCHFMPANRILPNSTNTRIGCDGSSDTGEIRPKEATTALEHWNNIRLLIRKLSAHVDSSRYKATAGNGWKCMRATGGHIHLSGVSAGVIPYLDLMSIAMLNIESKKHAVFRRTNSSYGGIHSARDQPWGFEYRTPASWIVNPSVAIGTLCTAHAIAYDYAHGKLTTKADYVDSLVDSVQDSDTDSHYRHSDSDYFSAWIPDITRMIKDTKLYKDPSTDYKRFIDHFCNCVNKRTRWVEGTDIFRSWNAKDVTFMQDVFSWNSDLFLSDIKEKLGSTSIEVTASMKSTMPFLRVFGLREDRDYDFITDAPYIKDAITDIFPGAIIREDSPDSLNDNLGIHYNLRKHEQERLVELLSRIYAIKSKVIQGSVIN